MDFNSTVDLIIKDLEEARKIIDDFRNYPEIPLLQIELAKSKCKSAAEVIALLKTTAVGQPGKKPERKPEPVQKKGPSPIAVKIPVREDNPESENIPVSTIIADTFVQQTDTLYEQIAGQKEETDLIGTIRHKPVSELSDVIGVNDKFLFIREIFNGSPETYNQAITKLDETTSIEDAKAIILSYSGEIKEEGAASQLFDLVKQKFTGNE